MKEQNMKQIEHAHPDTLRLQRMQVDLLRLEAEVRALRSALEVTHVRCAFCGTMVQVKP
jgi:hypothetical protein